MHVPLTAILVAAAFGGQALARQDQPADPKITFTPEAPAKLRVDPGVWYVGLAGDLKLPGGPAAYSTLNDFGLDSPRIAPAGAAHIRLDDRWRLSLSAMATSIDLSSVAGAAGQVGGFSFNPGDPIRASIDFATGTIAGGYSLGRWNMGVDQNGSPGFVPDLSLLGGLRVYEMDLGFGATDPSTARADEFFAEPVVGGRLEMGFRHGFSIDVETTVGWMPTDRSATSWDIQVMFSWRPATNLGVNLGYRNIWFELDSGSGFEWQGGAAGLTAGVQLRF